MKLKQNTRPPALSKTFLLALFGGALLASSNLAQATTTNTLFCDSFAPTNTPSPWTSQSCDWATPSGELQCGPNAMYSYGRTCIPTNWTDYSVQAQIRFAPNAYGGGLGGRLNETTGEHYAAWVYPRYTAGNGKLLRLVKFNNWTNWTLLAQTNVDLDLNAHALKLSFKGDQISVEFDGQEVVQATDSSLPSGGIAAEMWTDATPYLFSVDELTVSSLVETQVNTLTAIAPSVISSIAQRADGNMHFVVSGAPSQVYHLQAISDLSGSSWSNISTNTADGAGLVEFNDLTATNYPSRFYRISTP